MRPERRRKIAAELKTRKLREARDRRWAEEVQHGRFQHDRGPASARFVPGGTSNFAGAVGHATFQRPIKGMVEDVEVGCTLTAIDWRSKSRERAAQKGGAGLAMQDTTKGTRRLAVGS